VVLLTDGQNDSPNSQATADGSLNVARGSGVPIFTVGFGDQPDVQYLQALSSATSGEYLPATVANVSAVYQSIATLLRNQYIITLNAPIPADGKQASLRLVANLADASPEATATYQRGVAAAQPTVEPQQTLAAPAATTTVGGGSSRTSLMVFSAIVLIAATCGGGYLLLLWQRRRRVLARQLAVTAPNPMRAAAQPLPQRAGAAALGSVAEIGTGRLVEKTADGDRVHLLGAGPVVIGSAKRLCTITLPEGEDVAPEHVRISLRAGRYLLHHIGGPRRRTLVNGGDTDWVRLEAGDEVRLGRHRFVFEDE
jgi:hypothetical protein